MSSFLFFNFSIFSGEIVTVKDPDEFEEEENSSLFEVTERLEESLFFKIELWLNALYASWTFSYSSTKKS